MNIKRIFAVGLSAFFCLPVVFSVHAQVNNESVKDLRKALVKQSRYQVQEIVLSFKPKDFKSCEVSYKFEMPGSLGDENFGQATFDRNSTIAPSINNTSTTRTVTSAVTGNTIAIASNNNPIFYLREASFFNNKAVTSFNLSDLNADSLEVKSTSNGVYLILKTFDNKTLITKSVEGKGFTPLNISYEFLPVVSRKKAESVKELFVKAIKQCQTPN
jgi:hypothetical protein